MAYDPATLLPAYVADPAPGKTLEDADHDDALHVLDRQELRGLKSAVGLALGTPTRGKTIVSSGTGTSTWDTIARRNRLINGDMRVNQRVTLGTTDNSYTLDRWRLLLEAASAAAAAHETSDVPTDGSNRAMRLTVGSGEDNKFGVFQVLEFLDVADLRGKSVSLQAKLKATAAITDVRMAVLEFTGTADSVSGDPISSWGSAGTNPTLAASWAYLGTPANLSPTTSWATYRVEGLTVGASANNLAVMIWCEDESTTVTTDILRITDVQLEEGVVCTDVERIRFADALAQCQRYYHKTFELATAPAQNAGTTGTLRYRSPFTGAAFFGVTWLFPVRMRTAPTITAFNPSAANDKWRNLTDSTDGASTHLTMTSETCAEVVNSGNAGDNPGEAIAIHATAEAEL